MKYRQIDYYTLNSNVTAKAVWSNKYIRESKATMTPGSINSSMCANDLVFTSAAPTQYSVELWRVYNMTDISQNTAPGGLLPWDAKFLAGHTYGIEVKFIAEGDFRYDEHDPDKISTFTINGKPTKHSNAVAITGSRNRLIELTALAEGGVITDLTISGIVTPTEGMSAKATGSVANSDRYRISDHFWDEGYDSNALTAQDKFKAGETYRLCFVLDTVPGYTFSENVVVKTPGFTASSSSKKVEGDTRLRLYYNYKVTNAIGSVAATVSAPKAGQTRDDVEPVISTDGARVYAYDWYDGSTQMTRFDSFEAGKTYTLKVRTTTIKTFSDAVTVTVNGQKATIESRDSTSILFSKSFTIPAPAHRHSPIKVDEYKASCREPGRKSYYFCPECGKNFEDEKCTREISNINAWGEIPKLPHTPAPQKCGELTKCMVCKAEYGQIMQHSWGSQWNYTDANGHAHKCTRCGEHDTVRSHTPGPAATETTPQKCTTCGYIITPAIAHKHKLVQVEAVETSCKQAGKKAYYSCSGCGKNFEDAKGSKEIADISAWGEISKLPHTPAPQKCGELTKCTVCKAEYGEVLQHQWSIGWGYTDLLGHAYKCTRCGEHDTVQHHTPGPEATETTPQKCTVCGYIIAPEIAHKHKPVGIAAVDATCTENGMKAYYDCASCDYLFADKEGKEAIPDKDSLVIPAAGHKFNKAGKCTVCGYENPDSTDQSQTPSGNQNEGEIPSGNNGKDTDSTDGKTSEASGSNILMMIVVAVSGILVGVLIVVLILALMKKRKEE